MGLDISHDAFHGAYSAFNRFRQSICEAMGGSFPPHKSQDLEPNLWYWGFNYGPETHPGLNVLLSHSDCDGTISAKDCVNIADELEILLPKITGDGGGHIAMQGGYAEVTRKFICGCRTAASKDEELEFL